MKKLILLFVILVSSVANAQISKDQIKTLLKQENMTAEFTIEARPPKKCNDIIKKYLDVNCTYSIALKSENKYWGLVVFYKDSKWNFYRLREITYGDVLDWKNKK